MPCPPACLDSGANAVGGWAFRPARNPDLLPERGRGVDLTLLRASGRASARLTAFWTVLDDPVVNVTVSTSPVLIVRERRNAGRLRSRGVESELEWRPAASLRVLGTVALTDAVFAEGPEPGIEGNCVPQVPRYQVGAGVRYASAAGLDAAVDVRLLGERYEDDRNTLPLGGMTTADAMVSQAVGRGVRVFAAVEDLFDDEYLTGRTPLPTVGLPRTFRVGVRWRSP